MYRAIFQYSYHRYLSTYLIGVLVFEFLPHRKMPSVIVPCGGISICLTILKYLTHDVHTPTNLKMVLKCPKQNNKIINYDYN